MLITVNNLSRLDFRQLMDVYAGGNRASGAEQFPDFPPERQLLEAEQLFYQFLSECFFSTPGAFYALWVVDGSYVSALRLEPYRDGLLLEALETAPDQRRKGYASALLKAVLDTVGEQKVYSHVHKKNFPSLRTHEKCGFHRILEYASYADGSVFSHSCTFCTESK